MSFEALIVAVFNVLAERDGKISADGLRSLAALTGLREDWHGTFVTMSARFAGGADRFDLAAFRRLNHDPGSWTVSELSRCLRTLQARSAGGLVPPPMRQAALSTLFLALDRDRDGFLDQRELFALALALAPTGPTWPLPEDATSHTAAGWARVYEEMRTAHAAPPGGFDLPAFGRAVTAGPTGGAGGFRLTDQAVLELAAALSAPGGTRGAAPPAGRPPPDGDAGPHTAASASPTAPPTAAGPRDGPAGANTTAGPPQPGPPAAAAGAAPGEAATAAASGHAAVAPPRSTAAGLERAFTAYRRTLYEELFSAVDTNGDGLLAAEES